MEALKSITAIAAPLDGANIDTDRITPARLLRLPRDEDNDYAGSLFHDLRFNDDGSEISDFILNREPWRASRILVTGPNFGCGSSRESAVYALLDYGFRAIIAESFGDIFYSNCVRNGVAPLQLPEADAGELRSELMAANDPTLTVNVETLTVTGPGNHVRQVSLPGYLQARLVDGADEIAITLQRKEKLDRFEANYQKRFPWLMPNANKSENPA